MCALKRVVLICNAVCNRVNFGFQRFQRHVHTYRILPDADGLLAVQVSVHHHTDNTELRRKTRGKRNTIDVRNLYTENHSWSDGVRGIKQWFVTAWGTGTCMCFLSVQALFRLQLPCLNGISAMWLRVWGVSSAAQRRNCFYVSEIPTQPTH